METKIKDGIIVLCLTCKEINFSDCKVRFKVKFPGVLSYASPFFIL